MNEPIDAVKHVRRMHGGAQAQLMKCTDGRDYVVKFQNNPQHRRVLANEWIATRLAQVIGLPVAPPAIINVESWLVERTPELCIQLGGTREKLAPGLCFGSRYAISPLEGQTWDYLPESMLPKLRNVHEFAGILALDKWTCNADGRQAAYWKRSRDRKLTALFIDQGYCFNAGEWNFPDSPLRGVYGMNYVYAGVKGWESFEPWISRIEGFHEGSILSLAEEIPPEWYGGATHELDELLARLVVRRNRVRELITSFKNSSRNPFPAWN